MLFYGGLASLDLQMLELQSLLLVHKQNYCFSSSHMLLPPHPPRRCKIFTLNSFPQHFHCPSLPVSANMKC